MRLTAPATVAALCLAAIAATAGALAYPFDDSVRFDVVFQSASLELRPMPVANVVHATTAAGERYRCLLPAAGSSAPLDAQPAAAGDAAAQEPAKLLDGLGDLCVHRIEARRASAPSGCHHCRRH